MNFKTTLKLAIKEILSNKLRSILTMLGVIIGVFAIIVLVSIGEGAADDIRKDFEKGANTIKISLYPSSSSDLMKHEDVRDYFSQFDVDGISAISDASGEGKYESIKKDVRIKGVDKDFLWMNEDEMLKGRYISDLDVEYRQNIIVINETMKNTFFSNADPIGKSMKINGRSYQVVGLMKNRKLDRWEREQEEAFAPVTTVNKAQKKYGISEVLLYVKNKADVKAASDKVKEELTKKYPPRKSKWGDYEEEQFWIFTPEEILKEIDEMGNKFKLMLGGIAGISLLVGGIGIMNIMFVSVSERTREIGIRKAIGAKRRNILMQFLIEAAVVSSVGGLIGIGMGIGVSNLIGKFTPVPTKINLSIALLGFGFSLFVGVVFGIYPAFKAAKLKPIDALRYE